MGVTNVTSEVLQREYGTLRERLPKFCGCDMCRGDVLVYALNRLAPHYVSTRQGEILTELSLALVQRFVVPRALRRVRVDRVPVPPAALPAVGP